MPTGRDEDHGNRPKISHRQFRRGGFGRQQVVRFHREMMKRVVADPKADVARKIMVSVPGMFRARLLVTAVVSLAHQSVVLDVVDRLEDEMRAQDLSDIEQYARKAAKQVQAGQKRELAQRKCEHLILKNPG